MRNRIRRAGWLGVVAGVFWAAAGTAPAQRFTAPERGRDSAGLRPSIFTAMTPIPLDEIAPGPREKIRKVLEQPTLRAQGPVESFTCQPATYRWFLDHPDKAALIWRRLGARCLDIADRSGGRFGWSDSLGSDVWWDTVYEGPTLRIWLAEGHVKPGMLLPTIPIQAVVVLRISEGRDAKGRPTIRHQAELTFHTDSKSAALAARVVGPSAPRLAEQYCAQIEMFFSALSWYLDQHPERASALLAGLVPTTNPGR